MKRRQYLQSAAGIGIGLPFIETVASEQQTLEDNLERLFPQRIGDYERLRVDSEIIVYSAESGGHMKVYNHREGQQHLDVVVDSIRYQAFSFGQASRLLHAYVSNVNYEYEDGDSIYTGDDWQVVYRYHTVDYQSPEAEREYDKEDLDVHPLKLAGSLVESSVDAMWEIRQEYREVSTPFYDDWNAESIPEGTRYFLRLDELCFEYRLYDSESILYVYTVSESGEVGKLDRNRVDSHEQARQLVQHYLHYNPQYRIV
ncbi:hypothetical protein [Halorubrum vacuolatum]|uniref:Uncharacterized protein n=1 Tax=Halorubrum vacuolatum TaxID=63740 RepID=A0A238WSY6_HALVU|nr:hypothetical protein [Halorubrum vacuolatum]SNR49667.1 hypothetical protein SAMN06264855_1109 [Halorubrum vacuolatum]